MTCILLFLAPSATAFAQEEGATTPSPLPGSPAPDPAKDPVEDEERRPARPPFPPEVPPATTLFPDAVPNLRSSDLLPPSALGDFARPTELLRVGDFAISPSARLGVAYDDNVNADNTDREEDIIPSLSGSLRAQSLFARHSLGFRVDATVPFDEDDSETLVDWLVGADGRLDFTRRSSLSGAVRFTRGTESVESPEAGQAPTVTEVAGTIAYAHQLRRLSWTIGGGISRLRAEDDSGLDGLEVEDAAAADERDKTSYTASAGADYILSRGLSVFADATYALNEFDAAGDGGSRDSQSVGGIAGVELALGRAMSARLGAGYSTIFFDDPERDDKQAFTGEAGLDGAISLDRVTLLSLSLDHSTGLTTAEDAALVTRTGVSASITRSLSRRSAILASLGYKRSDFLDTERTDNDIVAQLGYSRTLFRNIGLDISYRFSQRFSDDEEDEFYRNIVFVGLSAFF